MKKVILLSVLALFIIPAVLALNLDVRTNTSTSVLINNINQPTTFNLQITNLGMSDNIHIYDLLGFVTSPTDAVSIAAGETKIVPFMIYPRNDLSFTGYYTFNYIMQGQNGDQQPEALDFKIINLKDAFSVGASEINPQSDTVTIYLKNLVNFNFGMTTVKFVSPFFSMTKNATLGPYDQKQFTVNLNRDDFKNLLAGYYTIIAQVNTSGSNATVEGSVDFSKQNILNVSENKYGFLIITDVIQKINKGNVIADSMTTVKKDVVSRIFTTFSPAPETAERDGFFVTYTWNNQIQPGDVLTITARTNWLLPLFILIFIFAIIILVTQYSRTPLSLHKTVTYLRAKGGEFALKVNVTVTARKFVDRVTVFDRLPFVAKLYEKFGAEKPTKVDEKNRRIEWHFEKFMPGETRVLSYIIYSKVGVLGRFALPTARAVYQREGKVHESESNQAFLVAEQNKPKEN